MAKLFDNVGQVTATTGTGTITLGAVITDATNGDYVTFTNAGAVAGDVVNYRIVNGNNEERGTGTLGGTGPGFTMARTVIQSTIGGTVGTTALTLSGTSNVFCVPFGKSANTWGGQQLFDSGTLTTSAPFTFTQTWNAGSTFFSGVEIDITDSGSAAATSTPFSVNLGGSPLMLVSKFGVFQTVVYQIGTDLNNPYLKMYGGTGLTLRAELPVAWGNGSPGGGEVGTSDTFLLRDGAANTLAMKNSTNSQTFRVYGSSTGGNDAYAQFNHSTGGALTISTQKTGTQTAGPITLTAPYIVAGTNTTVGSLTSAATAGAGARAFVTDASAPTFGATVAGGGAVKTPVYSDGTNWKVG